MLVELAKTPIRDIQVREPARASVGASVLDVVNTMRELRRGSVLLEDDAGAIAGIFTEADLILRLDHTDKGWHARPVRELMTASPHTLSHDDTIADALKLMHDRKFRHVPVLDEHGRAIGVLSIRDVLRHIAELFPAEFINLPPDPDHEATQPWGG